MYEQYLSSFCIQGRIILWSLQKVILKTTYPQFNVVDLCYEYLAIKYRIFERGFPNAFNILRRHSILHFVSCLTFENVSSKKSLSSPNGVIQKHL